MMINASLVVDRAISVILLLSLKHFEPPLHHFDVIVHFLESGGGLSRIFRKLFFFDVGFGICGLRVKLHNFISNRIEIDIKVRMCCVVGCSLDYYSLKCKNIVRWKSWERAVLDMRCWWNPKRARSSTLWRSSISAKWTRNKSKKHYSKCICLKLCATPTSSPTESHSWKKCTLLIYKGASA